MPMPHRLSVARASVKDAWRDYLKLVREIMDDFTPLGRCTIGVVCVITVSALLPAILVMAGAMWYVFESRPAKAINLAVNTAFNKIRPLFVKDPK